MPNTPNHKPGAIIIEGHVQGLSNTRALGETGIPVIVVDKNNCVARYSKYCKAFHRCPAFESDKLADFLLELAERENLKDWVLIPSNDHAVYTLSRNKERLEKVYKVITPGLEIIHNIYDKSRLLAIAQRVNVSTPKTFYADNTAPKQTGLTFPVLTKGRQGLDFYRATGKKAFLANDHQELLKQLESIAKVFPVHQTFTQELLPFDGTNKTISFTAFCDRGDIKTHWIGEKLREHPIRFGTATCARSISCDELFAPAQRLLQELNYTGVCEVEFLKDPRDGEYKLIEINARTWLWVGLAKACGVDFAKLIYQYFHDQNSEYPVNYETNYTWLNWFTDIPFSLIAILKSSLTSKAYLKSLKGKKVDAIWSKSDKKPGFAYLFLLPLFRLTR